MKDWRPEVGKRCFMADLDDDNVRLVSVVHELWGEWFVRWPRHQTSVKSDCLFETNRKALIRLKRAIRAKMNYHRKICSYLTRRHEGLMNQIIAEGRTRS